MPRRGEVGSTVKSFILKEFLPDEDPDELTESTELISTGILDSIAILKLVTHLLEGLSPAGDRPNRMVLCRFRGLDPQYTR